MRLMIMFTWLAITGFVHRDSVRFDQVWVPATGLSSGLERGDTIAATKW
jgi:hypothetical protein